MRARPRGGLGFAFLGLPELEDDGGEGDDGAEEFAGEFDAWVGGGHGLLGHGCRLIAKEIFPNAGGGGGHFGEAGEGGEGEIPKGEPFEVDDDEGDADDGVEEEPEEGIEGGVVKRWAGVDLGIDVISLEPGKNEEEGGEGVVEEFHRGGIDC